MLPASQRLLKQTRRKRSADLPPSCLMRRVLVLLAAVGAGGRRCHRPDAGGRRLRARRPPISTFRRPRRSSRPRPPPLNGALRAGQHADRRRRDRLRRAPGRARRARRSSSTSGPRGAARAEAEFAIFQDGARRARQGGRVRRPQQRRQGPGGAEVPQHAPAAVPVLRRPRLGRSRRTARSAPGFPMTFFVDRDGKTVYTAHRPLHEPAAVRRGHRALSRGDATKSRRPPDGLKTIIAGARADRPNALFAVDARRADRPRDGPVRPRA